MPIYLLPFILKKLDNFHYVLGATIILKDFANYFVADVNLWNLRVHAGTYRTRTPLENVVY